MNNKYFTPDIEDIHVGYEGEVSYLHEDKFTPFKLRHAEETSDFLTGYYNRKVRTPFLTKEQIEKEGWEFQEKYEMSGRLAFRKDNYFLILDVNGVPQITLILRDSTLEYRRQFRFIENPEHFNFNAEVKSINEFRKIQKMLNIK